MTMAWIALGVTVVGAGVTAAASIRQGQAAEVQAQFEADQMAENAKQTRQQAGMAEDEMRSQARKMVGTQLAAQSQAGTQLNGSASDLLRESLFNAESDAQNIRYEGENKARGYTNQAIGTLASGKNAKTNSYMSAAGSLMSSAGGVYGQYSKIK
jgi:hypothetical protein